MADRPPRCPDCHAIYPERRSGGCTNEWHIVPDAEKVDASLRDRIEALTEETAIQADKAQAQIEELTVQRDTARSKQKAAEQVRDQALAHLRDLTTQVYEMFDGPRSQLAKAQAFITEQESDPD